MSAHDHINQLINSLAERSTDKVIENLVLSVRHAVFEEVKHEFADRLADLEIREAEVERMAQAKLKARMPPADILQAASKVASAATVLENVVYSPAERSARKQLDKAIFELRAAINNHPFVKLNP
jgi:hypothetical protein